MRHGQFNRAGQVDDRFFLRSGLPDIKNRIAYFQGILRLGSRKTFRAVLKAVIPAEFQCQVPDQSGPLYGYLSDLLLRHPENLLI